MRHKDKRCLDKPCLSLSLGLILSLVSCLVLAPRNSFAEEKILSFDVDIKVLADSSLEVRETISVQTEGDKIKHGIYRDFPTRYRDRNGLSKNVGFEILSVSRDGQIEDYHKENLSNGQRVYLGHKDRFLTPARHLYQLSYRSTRQLGYFEQHDELYYNAIGTGWIFPIEKARVTVELPQTVQTKDLRVDGYTGVQGSKENAFSLLNYTPMGVSLITTRRLEAGEGFTISIGWPKGIVRQPTDSENFLAFLVDSFFGLLSILLLLISFTFYFLFWDRHGRDPQKGSIYPLFYAPKGLRPYDIPFLQEMNYVPKCLSSAIVTLAIKGHLAIKEESRLLGFGSKYTLEKASLNKEAVDETEAEVLRSLFYSSDTLDCESANHAYFEAARKSLNKSLEHKLSNYFRRNIEYLLPGILCSALASCSALYYGFLPLTVVIILLSGLSLYVFFKIMPAYTTEGRKLLDEIEGYKLYLDTAQKGHYDNISFPELTVERFESCLPFAVALGVEAKWMSAFKESMARAGQQAEHYSPHYFHGSRAWSDSSFLNNSSSFNSVVAASSTPPGSSSGGGGGGSSGGGGGGGGGGGW